MRRLDSKIKKWPGYILFHDPIPLASIAAWEEAMSSIDKTKPLAKTQNELLRVTLPCVAEWHLDNFPENVTAETFPGTPRKDSALLIAAIINEITKIYNGDKETDPNL